MKLPSQEYFTVAELADRWNTKEKHILDLLLNNKLWAVALVSGIATATWSDANGAHEDKPTKPQQFQVRTWFDPDLMFSIFKDGSGQLTWYVEGGKYYTFDPPISIRKDELLITREELERFESEHFSGSTDSLAPSLAEESELRRTQRTLAALAIGLADKYPAYRSGEKPNAKQLARLATEHLRDATSDRTPHGFSETIVRQSITAALKACPELTE